MGATGFASDGIELGPVSGTALTLAQIAIHLHSEWHDLKSTLQNERMEKYKYRSI